MLQINYSVPVPKDYKEKEEQLMTMLKKAMELFPNEHINATWNGTKWEIGASPDFIVYCNVDNNNNE